MDKFCLKWNALESNFRKSFKNVKSEEILFDVTLATEDGQEIQAHKIILLAGSNFFSDIFIKNNHSNMLIYLKGIHGEQLVNIMDFIYSGEAFVAQEDINLFLETAKELGIKGLDGEVAGNAATQTVSDKNCDDILTESDEKVLKDNDTAFNYIKTEFNTVDELGYGIEKLIEKIDNWWTCKTCAKTMRKKTDMQRHAEIHIKGLSHACKFCDKKYSTRNSLRSHISDVHRGTFSCGVCELTRMNNSTYRNHKLTCQHKMMSSNDSQ